MTSLNPHILFTSDARRALGFYRMVFGGELTISTFGDYEMAQDLADKDLVLHGQLTTSDGMVLTGADTPSRLDDVHRSRVSVSLMGENEARMEMYWALLSDEGTVTLPFHTSPWGGRFGMFVDRFGVAWTISYVPASVGR